MSPRSLPPRPHLGQLKRQAAELHAAHRDRVPSAAARIASQHPAFKGAAAGDVFTREFALADALLVIAREYGFASWADLKHRVAIAEAVAAFSPHPRFDEAVAAIDAGDEPRLRQLLEEGPSLVHARTNLEAPFHYFTAATLLHHVAGNPDRGRLDGTLPLLPDNIAEIARILLAAGSEVDARTLGPNGGTTMGLVLTSKQASDAGVSAALIDVLLEYGARLNLRGADVLDGSLANHAPRAAEKLIALGATPDVFAAAALGRLDLLKQFFDEDGRLRARARRQGRELTERDAVGLAALYAHVAGQRDTLEFLLRHDGNWNMTGVNNGTLLHRAAAAGDLPMVQRLVARGADACNRENPFKNTPVHWAHYSRQSAVVEWLAANAHLDLHTAAAFGLQAQARRRIEDDPGAVHVRLDDGEVPGVTPLHVAAGADQSEMIDVLVASGADVHALAGNGLSPLDVADTAGATGAASALERHGATRTSPLRAGRGTLERHERVTDAILSAYTTGEPASIEIVGEAFGGEIDLERLRADLQRELDTSAGAVVTLGEIRELYARRHGFESWTSFAADLSRPKTAVRNPRPPEGAFPLYRLDEARNTIEVRQGLEKDDWETVLELMAERRITGLHARGQMTDTLMARVAKLPFVTRLELDGSRRLTDAGMRHVARIPAVEHLTLSGTGVTDAGLAALRDMPALRTLSLSWLRGISDAGLAHAAGCTRLERVDLMGTHTGDEALRALAGKPALRHLTAGLAITEPGLSILQEYPAFKVWTGGEIVYGLMEFEAKPTYLLLQVERPSERALDRLAGLDGLFALNIDSPQWKRIDVTPLSRLARLGWLGHDADDASMPRLGALPGLRMLMAQDTEAGDDGFQELARSSSLEYIWGRRCYNLGDRGFSALSRMPSLRGLSVSCRNVGDEGLATLPDFPALAAFMPMDVEDDGFRHVGRCQQLDSLWCMYCRTTTDTATAHIAGLPRLRTYYAGGTRITDASLEMLGTMSTLEQLEFWSCQRITDRGAAALARLPRLREVTFDGCNGITSRALTLFAPGVRVRVSF